MKKSLIFIAIIFSIGLPNSYSQIKDISDTDLVLAYHQNTLSFRNNYQYHTLFITGQVYKIDRNDVGVAYIGMLLYNNYLLFYFDRNNEAALDNITGWDFVKIKGYLFDAGSEFGNNFFRFRNCSLVIEPTAIEDAQETQHTYKTYYNPRFKYSISYPSDILYPQGVAANGDGQKFLSKDERVVMLVYGQEIQQGQSLSSLYKDELSDRTTSKSVRDITYKIIKGKWFVVSGYESGKVFYRKTLMKNDAFLTFRIEYDKLQKSIFDPITAKIAQSLK